MSQIDDANLEPSAKRARTESDPIVSESSAAPPESNDNVSTFKVGGTKWQKHGMSGTALSFTPSKPPEAPKEEKEKAARNTGRKDFGPKDTILWYHHLAHTQRMT